MRISLAFLVAACLLGAVLSEPDPAPKPFPVALAEAFAKAFPVPQDTGAVGDLLSGLSTLLQNLLAALLGGGMAMSMMGGEGGEGGEGGCDDCCGCDSCGCGCCIQQCIPNLLYNGYYGGFGPVYG